MATKKTKSKQISKLFGYKASIDQDCIHSEREDKPYGQWSREFENKFLGLELLEGNHPDVVSTVDLLEKDGYFVWVEYSTGDSFGRSLRGSTEPIGVVATLSAAKELKLAIESWRPKRPNTGHEEFSFKHTTEDGQEIKFGFVPWGGYFERLEEVHIERVRL